MNEVMASSRPRIMLLVKSLGQGGAERQCCVLAAQLAQTGHDVCVVIYDSKSAFYAELLPASVRFVSLGHGRWNIPGLLFGLLRQIRCFNPDFLYSFMSHSNMLAALAGSLMHTRIVYGVRASGYDLSNEPLHARFGEYLHMKSMRFPDMIIVNSHAAKSELTANGLLPSQITVVANGIDTDRFRFDPTARAEIRTELGYGQTDRVIGMFARLHPMKGHESLLQAISTAAAQNPNLRLLLIGSGDRSGIDKLLATYGLRQRVTLLEQCQDIERYYSAIDMYCSASLYGEGFPNALAEAMASGLACIATDVGDSALILSNLGQLLAAGNVQQLSEAITSCSSERNEAQADERRLHIVNNFGLQQLGERTMLALRKTLES